MASFVNHDVDTEFLVLQQWWSRNLKPFADWFLLIEEQQAALIQKACPDCPKVSAATRAKAGQRLSATDLILPEFSEDALLAAGGKVTILFCTRRLGSKPSDVYKNDIRLLNDLYKAGKLPAFGNQKILEDLDTPFIDPSDPEENVCAVANEEQRENVFKAFEDGSLVRCQVWLCLKIRRTAIAKLLRGLVEEFEATVEELWKPKPTFAQLLKGELEQQATLNAKSPSPAKHHASEPGTPNTAITENSVNSSHFVSTSGLEEIS